MIDAVIFDFDGVLVESIDIKTKAFAGLFKAETDEVVEKIVSYHKANAGISRFEKFRYIYDKILFRALAEGVFQELCAKFSELVVDEVVNAQYVAGAREFLDKYHTVYKCFVASATPDAEMKEIIRRRNMSHYFREVHGAPLGKDAIVSDILSRYCFDRLGVLYVGDALSDYEAARKTGLWFLARENSGHLFDDIACSKARDLTGLEDIIHKINRNKPF